MYVRLAFAVAAHLEPEILLVDEVLAVGDIAFQKKCLGKMGDVARAGRTVVLVSHNMAAINALCSRCVILNQGGVEFDGSTDAATERYYSGSIAIDDGADLTNRFREGSGKAKFASLVVTPVDSFGRQTEVGESGHDFSFQVELHCDEDVSYANVAVILFDSSGYRIIDANLGQKGEFVTLKAGQNLRAEFLLREVLLRPGKYFVGLWVGREGGETIDYIEHAVMFEVAEGNETKKHSVVYPGTYLCRFEHRVTVN
jgi:lipopolysaccharide transport system ATP-binding protein